jgi:uncharacterized protein YihD (DUF1040 family)
MKCFNPNCKRDIFEGKKPYWIGITCTFAIEPICQSCSNKCDLYMIKILKKLSKDEIIEKFFNSLDARIIEYDKKMMKTKCVKQQVAINRKYWVQPEWMSICARGLYKVVGDRFKKLAKEKKIFFI